MTTSAPEDDTIATLTVSVARVGSHMMASIATTGQYQLPHTDRKFYSFGHQPPPGLPPEAFWGPILYEVSGFMYADTVDVTPSTGE